MTRRNFLSSSAVLGAGSLMNAVAELPAFNAPAAKVPIKVLATNWGFNGSMDEFCRRAKADGYDGFEVWLPGNDKEVDVMLDAATKHGLQFGLLCGASSFKYDEHFAGFAAYVRKAASLKPLYINTHAGKDFFTNEQNIEILRTGITIAKETGVPVYCETHRGRCAYSAPVTRVFMDALPDLKLTADLSHWCVVHESLLNGFENILETTLKRTHHIHARVGHAEGPQVNDPRAPEWANALKAHIGWWDTVMQHAAAENRPVQTFLCEFGPADYLPALPYTRQPVADQWGINVYMKQVLKERYT